MPPVAPYRAVDLDLYAHQRVLSGAFAVLGALAAAFAGLVVVAAELGHPFCRWPIVGARACDLAYESEGGRTWLHFCRALAESPFAVPVAALAWVVAFHLARPATLHVDLRSRTLVTRTSRWPRRARVVRLSLDAIHLVAAEQVLGVLHRWVAYDVTGRRTVLGPLRPGRGGGAAALDAELARLRGE